MNNEADIIYTSLFDKFPIIAMGAGENPDDKGAVDACSLITDFKIPRKTEAEADDKEISQLTEKDKKEWDNCMSAEDYEGEKDGKVYT